MCDVILTPVKIRDFRKFVKYQAGGEDDIFQHISVLKWVCEYIND